MILTEPNLATVYYVMSNLRPIDREEIFAVRGHDSVDRVTMELMSRPEMTWVAWHDGKPAVVFGGVEICPGVWTMHCFGTPDWPKLAVPLTRFAKRKVLPLLFNDFNAHRLEADSIASHTEAHRWIELCGARKEGVKAKRGRARQNYYTYVIVKGVDFPPFDKSDNPC